MLNLSNYQQQIQLKLTLIRNMIKTLTTLLICLLTVQFCFCQSGYPKLQVIGTDTIISLTQNQAKVFVKKKYELEKANIYIDSLSNRLNKCSALVNTQSETIDAIKAQSAITDELLKKSREIAKQQTIDNKKLEKNNRFLKTIVKITSTVAIVATITLVLLIKL